MHTFQDTLNRTWVISLNIGDVRRIRDGELKIDLLKLSEGKPSLLERMGLDIELTIDLVWELVSEQAEERGISMLDFIKGLGGQAAADAHDALYGELIDFFRQLRRPHVAVAVEKQRILLNLAIERAEVQMQGINLDSLLESPSIPGASSTTSPARSENTPTPTPSGS